MANGASLDPWQWTAERERAAELIADGRLNQKEIAAECEATADTLQEWNRHRDFRERVQEHLDRIRAKFAKRGLKSWTGPLVFSILSSNLIQLS